jgi:hypothetical protein
MRLAAVVFAVFFLSEFGRDSMAQASVGIFEGHGDIGPVRLSGATEYDEVSQRYTITGSGSNMWFDSDEFQFAWRRMRGDFILHAAAKLVGEGVEPHRKLGWIVRQSLEPDSPYVDIAVHGDGMVSLQFRRTPGGQTEEIRGPIIGANVLQLERQGNQYTMSVAWEGSPFATPRRVEVDLGDEVYVGLFVCAHNPAVKETGLFHNVQIIAPAADDFVPYRDYIGSNLEILDIATLERRVVFRSSESLQAPNWTRDGKALIYNSAGRLYRFDLETNKPAPIDTGFATRNNNDHVLSADGNLLGISHHSAEHDGQSIVYTLPYGGGTPKQITRTGPSYLHGFSPDGRWLVFTGVRNGNTDIYKIPVEGGDEVRLTDAPGLDDGPEFTPDGKKIFFNSSRSGRSQIWRMNPNGSDPEQVTDDRFNNWFPHFSPDGRWIVFLSFPPEVAPDDHPFYQRVYLQLMPAGGGDPRVIAYVYGGQGTINVPSWSPDSKRVAFVSNTAGN